MKKIEFTLGSYGTIVAILILFGGGFVAGKASVKEDVCTLQK